MLQSAEPQAPEYGGFSSIIVHFPNLVSALPRRIRYILKDADTSNEIVIGSRGEGSVVVKTAITITGTL